jgi:hypothetical protein
MNPDVGFLVDRSLLAELCCEGLQPKPLRVRASSQCCSTFVLAMLAP